MAENSNPDAHWEITKSQGEQLLHQGEQIGSIDSKVSGLETSVASLISSTHSFQQEMRGQWQMASKPKPPFNWPAVLMVGLLSMGMLGGALSFGFAMITGNMQREGTLTTKYLTAAIESMAAMAETYQRRTNEKFAADDLREQTDRYNTGVADTDRKWMIKWQDRAQGGGG